MIQRALEAVFLLLLLTASVRAVWRARLGRNPVAFGWAWASSAGVLSAASLVLALSMGYVAPFAIMQDIVSAQRALRGEALPTRDLQPLVRTALDRESPSFSLGAVLPGLASEEQAEQEAVAAGISEQAHPPFSTLFVVPFVRFLGARGTSVALYFLSLGMLLASLLLVERGLRFRLPPSASVLVVCAALGWAPMYWVLRAGQTGGVLTGLVVIGWYLIRRDRPAWGGAAIGMATSLKIFPGLLLLFLLLRERRAFVSGVLATVVLNLLAAAAFGGRSYLAYVETAGFVATRYADAPDNFSVLGSLHRMGRLTGIAHFTSWDVWLGITLAMVVGLAAVVVARRPYESRDTQYDAEFSLFTAAAVLLSPICWFHYYVFLLLPIAVLAKEVLRRRVSGGALSGLLALCLVLAAAVLFELDVVKQVTQPERWRLLGTLPLIPALALFAMVLWLAGLSAGPAPAEPVVPASRRGEMSFPTVTRRG